jgi:hypothetical protein
MQSIARQYKAREDVEGQFTEGQGIGKQDISGQCTTYVGRNRSAGVKWTGNRWACLSWAGQDTDWRDSAGQDRAQIGRTQLGRTGHRLAGQDTDWQDSAGQDKTQIVRSQLGGHRWAGHRSPGLKWA